MKQLSLFKDTEIFTLTDPKNRDEIRKTNPYLGPKSKNIGYKKYIDSKEWKRKKKFAIQLADYKCEFCEKTGYLEVHHSNYNCLYHERFDDVYVLCKQCHLDEDEMRKFLAGYETYMEKKYGPSWNIHRGEETISEFREWLEEKELFEESD
jgi:5-methylcytosine-specific restriction endonuclease McrA